VIAQDGGDAHPVIQHSCEKADRMNNLQGLYLLRELKSRVGEADSFAGSLAVQK